MRIVNMEGDPRQAQYAYFKDFADPYVSVTVNCDITHLRCVGKERNWPFFLTLLYCAVNAANSVPELRRRIVGDQVLEYEICISSHTVALENGSYCYCELDCGKPLDEFLPYAMEQVEKARSAPSLDDGAEPEQLYFVSSLPWLSFTALRLPTPRPADSNPRLTFGKFFTRDGQILIPVNITVHHALADGIHIARFFEEFDRRMAEL